MWNSRQKEPAREAPPGRSQGLSAASEGPRSTGGRAQQVLVPPREEDQHRANDPDPHQRRDQSEKRLV